MLILTMNSGEGTTITTPSGETIEVYLLGRCEFWRNIRVGFDAPDNYLILREGLRTKLLSQLAEKRVYRVTCEGAPTTLIVADSRQQALNYYHLNPTGPGAIDMELVTEPYNLAEFHQLERLWLGRREAPFGVVVTEM